MSGSCQISTEEFCLEDKPYHFIGIGGIGMSALARIMLGLGYTVSGSDLRDTPILEELRSSGATIFIGQRYEQVRDGHIVVFSSDIRHDNPELVASREIGVQLLHRSDLLGALTRMKKTILVAGSHGKTSTTGLLTHVLRVSGFNPNFALGGLLKGLNSNGLSTESEHFVVEADESDGTFLKYQGVGAIITNINDDHLAHYGSMDALRKAFKQFSQSNGFIVYCVDDPELQKLQIDGVSYGFSEKAHVCASNLRQFPEKIIFDITYNNMCYKDIEVSGFGKHTALNALGVFALALYVGCDLYNIIEGLKTFPGVQRRLQLLFSKNAVLLFDDYGHHPHEIATTLKAIKESYPEQRIVAVFEPHRYSRMHTVMHKLSDAFIDADIVIATDIYTGGEKPIEGVTIEAILEIMRKKQEIDYESKEDLVTAVYDRIRPHDVVVFFGAGESTKKAHALKDVLLEKSVQPLQIGLLYGSKSVEHDISAKSMRFFVENSSKELYNAHTFYIDIDGCWHYETAPFSSYKKRNKKMTISPEILEKLLACDIIFPILHGAYGEDGIFQGFLETLEKPYIGCSFRSSMLSMDKAYAKEVAKSAGVPVLEHTVVDTIKEPFKVLLPAFVKPAHLGSSIGIKKVTTVEELYEAIEEALRYDTKVLIERAVDRPTELEVAVITGTSITASLPGEIITDGNVYNFVEKYSSNGFQTRAIAEVSTEVKLKIQEYAKIVYQAIGCDGFARVDFFLDHEQNIWFNEINPTPGFTENSMYPKMMLAAGYTKESLIDQFVRVGLKRYRDQKKRSYYTNKVVEELELTIV